MGQAGGGLAQFAEVPGLGFQELGVGPGFQQPDGGPPCHGHADEHDRAGQNDQRSQPDGAPALGVGARSVQQQRGDETPALGQRAFFVRFKTLRPAASHAAAAAPAAPAARTLGGGGQDERLDVAEADRVPMIARGNRRQAVEQVAPSGGEDHGTVLEGDGDGQDVVGLDQFVQGSLHLVLEETPEPAMRLDSADQGAHDGAGLPGERLLDPLALVAVLVILPGREGRPGQHEHRIDGQTLPTHVCDRLLHSGGARGTVRAAKIGTVPRDHAAYSGMSTVSRPWLVLSARQTANSTSLEKKRTEPSHIAACTPPAWRLRAAIVIGLAAEWGP